MKNRITDQIDPYTLKKYNLVVWKGRCCLYPVRYEADLDPTT
jgi:hypothetical protein